MSKTFQINPSSDLNANREHEKTLIQMNRNDLDQIVQKFYTIFNEFTKLKSTTRLLLNTSNQTTKDHRCSISNLIDELQQIFLYCHNKNQKCETKDLFFEDSFLIKNNETLIEISVYIGSILTRNNSNEEDKFDLYLKYSNLITNLAEKTPIRFNNSLVELNKLVDYLIETSFVLIKQFSANKQIIYEIFRSLGALIYQNGSNLNIYNLNRLFGTSDDYSRDNFNEKTDGLIFITRKLLESDPLNNELNLITTQLIFNLTMPHNESSNYIDDKFKVKSIYLLIKILRSHSLDLDPMSPNDHKVNQCKILTKSLQSLENLLFSIQSNREQSNWIQSLVYFQLGDLLAIAKNLSFYGIIKPTSSKLNQTSEEKLQPNNMSILLDKKSEATENKSDEEEKPLNNSTKKFNNNKNKRFTKTNSKSNQQLKVNEYNLNSVQCLREVQVPLIQYKKDNLNQLSDSDMSADCSSASKFYMEKCFAKVRIAAIGVLLTAFQSLDKRTVLSYWDSFLGQNNKSYNLIWSVRNDQSPKVRLIAATTLSVYLECARSFFTLAASESHTLNLNQTQQSASFVPISHTIANLIRQLHSDLSYSLNIEKFSLNQLQLLKCVQCLIKATPYHKLKPGLVYKLITNLNLQLNLKLKQKLDSSLVEILNCLLLVLTNHYQLAEVHLALISNLNKDANIDQLSEQLEQCGNKCPSLTQSRVTYFYTNDSQSFKSSLNESLVTSGQLTPLFNDLTGHETQKSWLVNYCLKYYQTINVMSHKLVCLDLLQIICKKYFDLIRKDLFYDDLTQIILVNIEKSGLQQDEQIILKTLKLLEELARCLATNDLRQMNQIDLNDCCKFWSSLLSSNLITQLLCNEQYYLISSAACDCLASIGAQIFELLPFQKRIYCLTNLLHLTKSSSSLIRSSSVRALGVYVTFTSLKEDQNFLNDLSQCLISLLNLDQNNLVRQKAAWSLSNLSEVLVENQDKLNSAFTDDFNLTIWLKLLDVSSNTCARESDKLKSYLVRTIGNLIRYITGFSLDQIQKELKDLNRVERVVTKSIETLSLCRSVKMLKVKWNLSHAIGVAMYSFSSWDLQFNNKKWLLMFYDTLLDLFTQSTNFKVRINACIALMTVNLADKSSNVFVSVSDRLNDDSIFVKLWICLIDAFAKINNENLIDAENEVQHKTTLIHQLCKLFTYLCKNLRINDLNELMLKCLNKVKLNSIANQRTLKEATTNNLSTIQLRQFLIEYIRNIFDQIELNKLEVQYYNEALTHLNLLNSNKQNSLDEDCIILLNSLLQRPPQRATKTESESSESDNQSHDLDYRKKFPFSQVYD